MQVLDPGHTYSVSNYYKGELQSVSQSIQFTKSSQYNPNSIDVSGTNCQELLRVLIDRVQFLDSQLQDDRNTEIIKNLRKALVLFEQRHLDRLLDKEYPIEKLITSSDGHVVMKNIKYTNLKD